jgi:hypothetical protein
VASQTRSLDLRPSVFIGSAVAFCVTGRSHTPRRSSGIEPSARFAPVDVVGHFHECGHIFRPLYLLRIERVFHDIRIGEWKSARHSIAIEPS